MLKTCFKYSCEICRVYVERYTDTGLRLYITKIQESDAGIYKCKARLPHSEKTIEHESRMFLFGKTLMLTFTTHVSKSSRVEARGTQATCMNVTRSCGRRLIE